MSNYIDAIDYMKGHRLAHRVVDHTLDEQKGAANGLATLDGDAKLPVEQIPDYLEAGDGVSVDFNKIGLNITAGRGTSIEKGEGTELVIGSTLDVEVFKVVDALPDRPAEGCESKIYVVKASSEEGNEYEEYIWNAESKSWEAMGAFQIDLDTVDKAIKDEAAAREAADATLTETLSSTSTELRQSIEDEEAAREAGDAALKTALDGEEAERKAQDGKLQEAIDALKGSTDDAMAEVEAAIEDEKSAREEADAKLQSAIEGAIDTHETDMQSLTLDIGTEATNRESADATLQTNIEAEAKAREEADAGLQEQITSNDGDIAANAAAIATNAAAIEDEAKARTDADETLQTNIDDEATARETKDDELQNAIGTEKARAEGVEGQLSSLTTEAKSSLVDAIDEVDANADANAKAIEAETERAEGVEGSLAELDTEAKDSLVAAINEVDGHADDNAAAITTETERATGVEGQLSDLKTAAKTSLVDAINENKDAIDANGESIGSITVEEVTEGLATNVLKEYALTVDGAKRGAAIDIYKDSSVSDVHIGVEADGEDPQRLYITYIKADGTTETVNVDFSSFIAEAEMGDGMQVSEHKVSIKLDESGEAFLTVGADGLKLSGVQDAIDAALDALDAEVGVDLEGYALTAVRQADGKLSTGTTTSTIKNAVQLKTARTIGVTDASGDHNGTGAKFNGTADVTLKLPSTICADVIGDVEGNADTATSATKATQDGDGNVISSTYQKKLTAGTNVTIDSDNKISATDTGMTSVATSGSGNVVSGASYDASARKLTLAKGFTAQEKLTAGTNITISGTTISATDTTYSEATTSAKGLMSASDKKKLDGIAEGAEVNQNAFAKVTVGSTTIEADAKSDTLTVVAGANVTLTPDATSDKLTIAAKDTTYSAATTSAAGLMSASDKAKLDGITASADSVSVTQSLTTGTKVGEISVNDTSTTLYAPTNTDTKNTAGSTDSSSKLFLIGAASQAANPQTYSHDTAYVGTDGCLYSGGKKVVTDVDSALSSSSTNPVQNKAITSYVQGIFSYDEDTATLTITV